MPMVRLVAYIIVIKNLQGDENFMTL